MESFENIFFISGIHGVGKGTICKEIASKSELIHLTASEVLKWSDISSSDNKLVENISSTQEKLIFGLNNLVNRDKKYLLDGHFCLLNSLNIPCKIDEETFDILNPWVIFIVIDDIEKIAKRLENRDGKKYDIQVLNELQNMEIEYAKYLSRKYSVPYIEIIDNNYEQLLNMTR
ncbi:ATP-binding protein [Flavobacterium sharifuzzamanii]|uniref:ATP-binding protein n=1 Tax=Flavobacterium sharifuzzamanii TaxID=2211133 RepID=UPI000DAE785D|nr:ATP-binding protein [Flavobacterium sharifuzzamanii]KAF2079286.1 AAA family ATPase [Flavobacterium sharifuzzamanii]